VKRMLLLAALLFGSQCRLKADSGALIPRDQQQPNPAILSLQEMEVDIVIDNGDAKVFVRQIFANHTANIEEGTYVFALPSGSTVSDFAVWDDSRAPPCRGNLRSGTHAGNRSGFVGGG